jgi:hypothetical protein
MLLVRHAIIPFEKKHRQRYVLKKQQELPHSNADSQFNKIKMSSAPAAQL